MSICTANGRVQAICYTTHPTPKRSLYFILTLCWHFILTQRTEDKPIRLVCTDLKFVMQLHIYSRISHVSTTWRSFSMSSGSYLFFLFSKTLLSTPCSGLTISFISFAYTNPSSRKSCQNLIDNMVWVYFYIQRYVSRHSEFPVFEKQICPFRGIVTIGSYTVLRLQ